MGISESVDPQRTDPKRELILSDPVYRQEQNQRVAKLPRRFAKSLEEEKRKQKLKEIQEEDLHIKPPSSFVQEDDVSI